jgi:hypothetical protein
VPNSYADCIGKRVLHHENEKESAHGGRGTLAAFIWLTAVVQVATSQPANKTKPH